MTEIDNIGRYQIDQHIGSGAMADVYKATDTEIHRVVAIKILKESQLSEDCNQNLFLNEVKAAGRLIHPNIVTVHDVGVYENKPFIVMEYVEGETLSSRLEREDDFSLLDVINICSQLVSALAYAHESGVVHRDVKPDNILCSPCGTTVKLADFGVAYRADKGSDEVTDFNTLLGTPRYMSPEQALGDELDGRSDLFSFGSILYELLSGQKAFNSSTVTGVISQITSESPELLNKFPSEVPKGIQHILTKLLEKEPSKRPQSGHEVLEVLTWEKEALLAEQEPKKRYIPFYVKWTLITGAIIGSILAVCLSFVLKLQADALTEYSVDSGTALAKFIATESAIPVLGEDWITLESLIDEAAKRDTFESLIVMDHAGQVRVATDPGLVGKVISNAPSGEVLSEQSQLLVERIVDERGDTFFNFTTPILFKNTAVGSIRLSLQQNSLEELKKVTAGSVLLVGLVMLVAVVILLFISGRLFAKQLQILNKAMAAFISGSLNRRISHTRKDEIGELFQRFNQLADEVQSLITETKQTPVKVADSSELEVQPHGQVNQPDFLKGVDLGTVTDPEATVVVVNDDAEANVDQTTDGREMVMGDGQKGDFVEDDMDKTSVFNEGTPEENLDKTAIYQEGSELNPDQTADGRVSAFDLKSKDHKSTENDQAEVQSDEDKSERVQESNPLSSSANYDEDDADRTVIFIPPKAVENEGDEDKTAIFSVPSASRVDKPENTENNSGGYERTDSDKQSSKE